MRTTCILVTVALLAGCGKENAPTPQTGEAISGKPAPRMTGPMLTATEQPSQAPLVGEIGKRPDGYPWQMPDKVKLLGMLRMQQYDALDRFFTFYQDAFEKDYHYEDWPDQAAWAFFVADPSLGASFDAWIERSPQSFAARLARGAYRVRLGWHYRGGKYASKTTEAQFAALDVYLDSARVDFEEAIRLRPRLLAAQRRLMALEKTTAKQRRRSPGELLRDAIVQCELCATPREEVMRDLVPRWHGSYELMREFAAHNSPLFGKNPRLATLSGFEDIDRCELLWFKKQYDEAIARCQMGLSYGETINALLVTARVRRSLKQYDEARALLDRALRLDPHYDDAVSERAYVRADLRDYAGAASDTALARHLDPTGEDNIKLGRWLVDKLRYDGSELNKAGKKEEAAKLFSLGLQLAPDDRDLMLRMGHSERGTGQDEASIQAQLAAAPDDFELRQRIDAGYAASNRFADVVAMWDAYIAGHLRDPRAYWERAGAHWHLRAIDSALGDMQHACALGMDRACTDVKRMKMMAGR